jgi:hypothetical protein
LLVLKYPWANDIAPKFLALAERHPKDPAAVEALVWVATHLSQQPPAGRNTGLEKALEILRRDHLQRKELGRICPAMSFRLLPSAETFLRELLAKSPHAEVQAEACVALAQGLSVRSTMVRHVTKNPDAAKFYAGNVSKEYVEALLKEDPAQVDLESLRLFREFTDKHLETFKPDRLKSLCHSLSSNLTVGRFFAEAEVVFRVPMRHLREDHWIDLGRDFRRCWEPRRH